MTLQIQTDRNLIRAAASSTRYVLARINAPRAAARDVRPAVNVGIVLDRSGSMASEQKFGLARDAVEQSLQMLQPDDRFSLVVYDDRVDVLMPSSLATQEAKRRALGTLRTVEPRGSTDLGAGWLRACEQVAEFLGENRVDRCLLLTDGLANQGITDRDELTRHAGELRQRGIATSTFGVGADFDERLLLDMAREGGGHFYFIEGAAQIPALLTGELGEALEVTLRNAALRVSLPRGGAAESLNRFRQATLRESNELRVELGDLVSGQELDVVVKLTFPRGDVGDTTFAEFVLAAGGDLFESDGRRQQWTYASHQDNDVQPRNREVDRAVAEQYATRARAEATEANRHGQYDDARRVLDRTAHRIASYAGGDTALQHIAQMLRADITQFAEAPMSAMELKSAVYALELAAVSRTPSGRARRAP